MKVFDILNGYKMDGRKRPIRGGFGLWGDFVYKSRSFIGILGCKKRVFSNAAFQDSQKMGKFSASLSPARTKQEKCQRTRMQTEKGGLQPNAKSEQKKYFYFKQQGSFQPPRRRRGAVFGQLTSRESNTLAEQGRGMVEGLGQPTPLESITHAEQGRGMVEMIGVLAVIGILSITGILGYRYAMNKSRANDVLNYVRIGHTIISAMKGVPTKATPNDLEELKYPSTDLPYYYGDETAFYIGMPAIEKGVCQLIPDMIASPIIGVYTIDGESLTPDKCTENIELEYAFEWGDNQELECLLDCGDHGKPNSKCLACDCMPRFAGDYCDECAGGWQTEEGSAIQCSECPEPFTQQGDVCGCTVQGCDTFNTTTDCSCAKCSTEFNYELKKPVNENGDACEPDEEGGACGWLCEAKEGNMCSYNFENSGPYLIDVPPEFCSYTYENPNPEMTDVAPEFCSYRYENPNPEMTDVLPEFCSYTYTNPNPDMTDVLPEFCFYTYTNPNPTDGSTAQMEAQKDCLDGQYCYPRWTDKSCGSTDVGSNLSSGTIIYGTCHDTGTYTPSCSIGQKASTAQMEAQKDCLDGQYCYPRWTDKSCGDTDVGSNLSSGTIIYGTCHDTGTYTPSCSIGQKASTAQMKVQKDCLDGQYCYPRWIDKSCGDTDVGSNLSSGTIIYGTCHDTGTYTPSCSIGQRATEALMWPEKRCPAHQYCYPKWLKEDCTQEIDNVGASLLFGVCAKTSNYNVSSVCPIQN